MLQVRALGIEAGGLPLVEGVSFNLHFGEKVGLVGRNGAGKTTLLQVLAGEAAPVQGVVLRQGRLGYLRQDPRSRGVDLDIKAITHILEGRGIALAADRMELPVRVLSGGERRRLELARILFAGSDLLLLDEPTNHLDNDAKSWLMKFLASYRGALMVVSHDLMLLDRSITRVMHLDDGRLVEYRGTYSQYREARRQEESRLAKVAARQQAEIKRLSALADSMRHQTEKRARKAKSLDTRVERMKAEAVSAPKRVRKVNVRFPEPPHTGRVVLTVTALWKGYGGPPLFEDVSFDLPRGERLMVIGLNGAGKTSLLRILAGESEADSGEVRIGAGVSMGYYAQEHEGITPGLDVISHMRASSTALDQ